MTFIMKPGSDLDQVRYEVYCKIDELKARIEQDTQDLNLALVLAEKLDAELLLEEKLEEAEK